MTDYTVACSVVDKSHVTGVESDSNSVWKNGQEFIQAFFWNWCFHMTSSNCKI